MWRYKGCSVSWCPSIDVSKCWNCSILSSSPGHKARLESDNLTQNWAAVDKCIMGWGSGQEVVTADITSDISCINTSLSLSSVLLDLKKMNFECKTLGLQLNSADKTSQERDKTVVDSLASLTGKSCCSSNVHTSL